jgi:hypothetical protein
VGDRALARSDVGVDRLADDRMCELEPLRRPQDLERGEPVRRPRRLGDGQLGELRRLGDARAVAEHRDRPDQCRRRRRRRGEPQHDRSSHGGRTDVAHAARARRIGGELLARRLDQQRLEQKRVAAGGLAAGCRELGRHLRAESPLAHARGCLCGQWRWAQHTRLRSGRQAM